MNKLIGVIKRNSAHLSFFLLFALIFLLGELFGGVLAAHADKAELTGFGENLVYSAKYSSDNATSIVLKSAVSVSVSVMALWLGGFAPKIPCVLLAGSIMLYKGTAMGYTVGMMLRIYSLKGFALAAASILPQYIILLPLMFAVATVAVCFLHESSARKGLKGYFALGTVFLVTGLLSSLADSMVSGKLLQYLF